LRVVWGRKERAIASQLAQEAENFDVITNKNSKTLVAKP
jgi:hypothetical protein